MKIKILSDSTCDLSPELLEKYDITLIPLIVMKDDQEYRDGVTIPPADIFAHVAAGGSLCSTAALSVGVYQEIFEKYAKEYDGVIHVNIGSGFSSSYQNACLAAEDIPNVRVVDSQNLTSGQGLVVLKACELAQTCTDLDELHKELAAFTEKIETSFVLDQLKYMAKGGRCSSAAALGANLLNLKPCIEVKDGKMTVVKKYRGSYTKCLTSYVHDRLAGREDVDESLIFITHTPVSDEQLDGVIQAIQECGSFRETLVTEAGCTVSCHCGPGTVGVIFVKK